MKGILQLINSEIIDEPDLVITKSTFLKYSKIFFLKLKILNFILLL